MKNRLQFNRIPALFTSGVTYLSGTTMSVSGREKATEGLEAFVKRRDFIPLIGEPIVVRYIDGKGKKQAMLAIGKATGSTENDTRGIEYHIIDTAKLQEDIDLANENASEALELASAATKDNADYLTILQNMIISGVGLTDGTYFDNNGRWDRDPSRVGLYDPIENANYISDATSFRDADDKLDKAIRGNADNIENLSATTEDFSAATHTLIGNILAGTGLNTLEHGEYPNHDATMYIKDAVSLDHADVLLDAAIVGTNDWFNGRCDDIQNQLNDEKGYREALKIVKIDQEKFEGLGIGDDVRDAYFLTHHKPNSAEPYEDPQEGDVIIKVYNETVTWNDLEAFSGITEAFLKNIIVSEGLNSDGTYDHQRAHDSVNFKDAFSAFEADELLDQSIANLSANTMAADQVLEDAFNEKIDELSANTIASDQILNDKINELSGNTMSADEILDNKIDELSANTIASDQVLQDQIDELGNRKVLGISAITVEALENGDSKVSLVINEEDDKVLTQNALGLKANVSLVYNREDKKIYLKGKNDTIISEVDAKDFIKDGMLSAASVFTATELDHEQYPELVIGKTYIKLLFNVDGEEPRRANPLFISAEDLVDIYTVDPESHTFMEINDYFIKLNVDKENGLASYNYARNISAVTANIISATGLNMGEQGGYLGHDETHYIKNAGSLDQADVLLDEAIWGNNQGLVELSATTESFSSATHTVIENILVGTGLNTQEPGEYHGHDDTHIIKDATSLDNADVLLDEALWVVSGMVVGFDERIDEIEEDVAAIDNRLTLLSAVTAEFSASTDIKIAELSARTVGLGEVYEYIDSGDTALKEHIDEVEEVIAGSLSDLNDRIDFIETHLNGEYIPLTGYELASGLSADELIVKEEDSVNDAFGKIQKQILDDEETVAAALNDLNRRVNENAEEIAQNTGVTVLSATVESFSSATYNMFNQFGNNITNINEDVQNLSGETINLSGAVMSISAKTSGVLTINLNGIEQGKYSPSANTSINIETIEDVTGEDVLLTNYVISSETNKDALEIKPTDNVNQAFGKIEKKVNDNELVANAAINGINTRIDKLSGSVVANENTITILSGLIIDDELVMASALNELNNRVVDLSGNTGNMYAELDARISNLSGGGASQSDVLTLSSITVNNVEKINTLSSDVLNCFDGAEYNSTDKKIYFKHGNTVKGEIDATAFIKDGMVDNVSINSGNLVITFNTDAGKENIVLALTDIFDPNNYYNKTEINVLSSATETIKNNLTVLSGAVESLSASVVTNKTNVQNLSAATAGLENNVDALSASVETNKMDIARLSGDILDDEIVIASALNDLNSKIWELSYNVPDMSNYYSTANTYSKAEVQQYVSMANQLRYTTSNTLSNLAFSEFLTIATITGDTELTISNVGLPALPANGVIQRHLIIENANTGSPVVVTIADDARVKITPNNDNFKNFAIDAGGRGELNLLITHNGSAYTIYVITT